MAKASRRFLKGSKQKNAGSAAIKQIIKAIENLEEKEGLTKVKLALEGSTDFTRLRTYASQFRRQANIAHTKALAALAPEIKEAITEAMNTKAYGWDYGDGDIVQTGQLRDSVEVVSDDESIIVTYSAISKGDGYDYAAIVYYGGYIHPYGNPYIQVYMPKRPWVQHVLKGGHSGVKQFPLADRYLFYFKKFLIAGMPTGTIE